MTDSKVMSEIKEGFAERLNVLHVDETKSLKDLGLDSLDLVEMCMDLEDKYGISFDNDELSSIQTVSDLYSSIEKKLDGAK